MHVAVMVFWLFFGRENLQFAVLRMRIRNTRTINRATPVHDRQFITYGMAQHPHTMRTLLFGEHRRSRYVGTIK